MYYMPENEKDISFNATQVSSEERRKLTNTANTNVTDTILEAMEWNKAKNLR